MAINYAKIFNRRTTPQSQPIPGSTRIRNSGGGYAWQVDDWTRLDRFLILGAEGGTYYITEHDLVKQNHDALVRCIKADGTRAVNRIVEISDSGRAPKNDPAVFALALVVTHGDAQAKAHAFSNLGKVCRIGTHLFHFAEYVNAMRGWGRGLRNAVAGWYVEREVKRKIRGEDHIAKYGAVGALPKLIEAFEQAKRASNNDEIVKLITEFDLPREAIPTQWLNEVAVWEAQTVQGRQVKGATQAGARAPACTLISIPLAEEFRRRFAKPQRLVRLQHGIPFLRVAVFAYGHQGCKL